MRLAIYVIFYNSIFELIEVSTQQPRCVTTSDSAEPGKPCINPFKSGHFTYFGCLLNTNGPIQRRRWCSTGITESGQIKYGYCNSDCPNHYSSLDFDSFDFPIFDWSICHGILLKVGDNVKLTDSESVLKSELSKVGYGWEEEMKDMLGKVYEVLSGTNDIVVALNSPNGEQNGKWYFPKSAFSCISEAGTRRYPGDIQCGQCIKHRDPQVCLGKCCRRRCREHKNPRRCLLSCFL